MVAGGVGWAITTPLCLLQGARSAASVRHDFLPELTAERQIYLHARKGEYGALAKDTFETVCAILENQISGELKAINSSLPGLIKIHPWSDNA